MHDVFLCMAMRVSWIIQWHHNNTGIKDLLKVLEEIKDVNNKWKFLGLALGLKKPTLDSIKSNGYEECKMEMIEKWLNKEDSCDPSWSSLVNALRNCLVEHNLIADEIEKKYL